MVSTTSRNSGSCPLITASAWRFSVISVRERWEELGLAVDSGCFTYQRGRERDAGRDAGRMARATVTAKVRFAGRA